MRRKIEATLKFLKEIGVENLYAEDYNKDKEKALAPLGENETKSENLEKKATSEVSDNREKLLEELYEKNKNCCRCDLCKSRTRIVFYDGNPYSKVVFVGEAPGADEDRLGKPFVGRAGQYLNKVLEKIGWSRKDIYITNVCKCRPPENRKPLPKEMQTCFNVFLKNELKIIKPKVICCLGATAAEALLGKHVRITKMRGKFYPSPLFPGVKLFLTYHPAYILRNMREAKTFEEDLRKLKEFVEKLEG
jgi:DNA polymerase